MLYGGKAVKKIEYSLNLRRETAVIAPSCRVSISLEDGLPGDGIKAALNKAFFCCPALY